MQPRAIHGAVLAAGGLVACGGAEEAARVALPVYVEAPSLQVETNLGYSVELSEVRLAIENLEFAVAGEAHASLTRALADWLVPTASAHSGHAFGGDVTGELRGTFVMRWPPAASSMLGTATLLAGDYQSANFTLRRALPEDGIEPSDALLGHTARLRGSVRRAGWQGQFAAIVDAAPGEQLVGVPCAVVVPAGSRQVLGLELALRDPFEGDTLFDGIDFEVLQTDADGLSELSAASDDAAARVAQARLAEALLGPDHFLMRELEPRAL